MKKAIILLTILLITINVSKAQSSVADNITGIWLTAEKDAKIEIYKAGDKYFGKIIFGKNLYEADGKTLIKDGKNPDAGLRGRPVLNLIILSGFVYNDGEYKDGKIYDPQNGKTYSAFMKLKGSRLDLRGYVGVSLFGRTTTWSRL